MSGTCTVHFSSSIIVKRLAEQAVVPVAPCSEKGLSDSDVAQLQGAVDAAVQENMGMAMVYGLVTAAQEWLTDKARVTARVHWLPLMHANVTIASCRVLMTLSTDTCRHLERWTHRTLQATQMAEPAPLDPAAARKAAEEAEERRLAEIRSHGTPVTPDTFAPWKERFYAELKAARSRYGVESIQCVATK